MKRNLSSIFWLIICAIEITTLATCAPTISNKLPRLAGTVEPPDCLDDVIIQVTSNPSHVMYGQSSIVSWSIDLPPQCGVVSVARLNGKAVNKSGSQTVMPSRNPSTYKVIVVLTYRGTPVTLAPASTQVAVDYPTDVVIDQNTVDPVGVLLSVLQSMPTDTVELCNVDLDLTGYTNIVIGEGKSLIAKEGCERGPHNLGPRIFVTDKRGGEPLFSIQADHAKISGFRLEGPTSDIAQGDTKEKGLLIEPLAEPPTPPIEITAASEDEPIKIEISNMEIYHWSGIGVQVTDNVEKSERGRLLDTNPEAVHIWGNFLHHNRHGDGFGYGVAVTDGAYALIEQNVFDENRHAIAGESKNDNLKDYSGYTARDNLILAGGGRHCADKAGTGAAIGAGAGAIIGAGAGAIIGGPVGAAIGAGIGAAVGAGVGAIAGSWCWQTHQIDMHGDQSSLLDGSHGCGTAGETIHIERNSILYTWGNAIKIRGNPRDKAVVDDNVFTHEHDGAVEQNGNCGWIGDNITNPVDVRPNNLFDSHSYGHYGVCDFDGDGIDDLFYPTGKTWWYSSYGKFQWTYLSDRTETMDQVRLGYFDDDLKCDVLTESGSEWVISSGGTGEWTSIGAFGVPLKDMAFGQFDPNVRDHRPGVTRRTTDAFWRTESGQWKVTPLSAPDWQNVESSSFPMSKLRFGDFTGDGVTDVLALDNGHWAISENARGKWQRLNDNLNDDVSSLYIADLNNNNIDDLMKLEHTFSGRSETYTWWVSDDGRSPWRRLKIYTFQQFATLPVFAFSGRFGNTSGGGVLLIDRYRVGHFFSPAEISTGATPDWTSLFPY